MSPKTTIGPKNSIKKKSLVFRTNSHQNCTCYRNSKSTLIYMTRLWPNSWFLISSWVWIKKFLFLLFLLANQSTYSFLTFIIINDFMLTMLKKSRPFIKKEWLELACVVKGKDQYVNRSLNDDYLITYYLVLQRRQTLVTALIWLRIHFQCILSCATFCIPEVKVALFHLKCRWR